MQKAKVKAISLNKEATILYFGLLLTPEEARLFLKEKRFED